jgi:hypothetical protein
VADTGAAKTAEGAAGTRADRAKLMGQDYMPPEEAATKSRSDEDN